MNDKKNKKEEHIEDFEGIIFILFGGLICLIPILGWILGPILIFYGIFKQIKS